jgi:hypothetical protein
MDNDLIVNDNSNIKNITIQLCTDTKKINCIKEKKKRIETNTWTITEPKLSFDYQLFIIRFIYQSMFPSNNSLTTNKSELPEFYSLFVSHLKSKINSYKQQDIIKKKYNPDLFVSFFYVLYLLQLSNLLCVYCSEPLFILYELVRENKQWSLDRINNEHGHNRDNLVIACLECNLKRRRTNKDAFMFTKNLVITKQK